MRIRIQSKKRCDHAQVDADVLLAEMSESVVANAMYPGRPGHENRRHGHELARVM